MEKGGRDPGRIEMHAHGAVTAAGSISPFIFGSLVHRADPSRLLVGYLASSALMLVAAVVARRFGVASEGRSLESLSS